MNDTDRKRLKKALREAMAHVDAEAQCYCFREDSEYQKVKTALSEILQQLEDKE